MYQRQITEILRRYGLVADGALCRQIETYVELLLTWNRKVSLTAIRDPEDIVRFHFGESLLAKTAVPVEKGRLADVGSGAGFPGIPLAITCPSLQVMLIEANKKKAAFLGEATRALKLANVSIVHERLENVEVPTSRCDFITARALGNYEYLLEWAAKAMIESGDLILWLGRDDAQEIVCLPGWIWRDPIKIPMSLKRVIMVGCRNMHDDSVPRGTH